MTDAASPAKSPTITDYLAEPLRLGNAGSHGSLTVYPIFGPAPRQPYVSFAQGREAGVIVKELDEGASVNDVLVQNPTDVPVLLFEGEEVLGAQQNRTFDVTALVPAGRRLQVPVSCVEAGRWDGSRSQESFDPAPQAAHPELRRHKAAQVRAHLDALGEARANQAEVWDSIAAKSARMGVSSATGAMHDVFEGHRGRLGEYTEALPLAERQTGALVAIAGRFVVCDWVSRPEVFASLYEALLQGYALDALEAETRAPLDPPDPDEAEAFISLATEARAGERDGIGLGRELRFAEGALIGTGLATDRELVQLTVHNGDADAQPTSPRSLAARRIRRPSRRRAA